MFDNENSTMNTFFRCEFQNETSRRINRTILNKEKSKKERRIRPFKHLFLETQSRKRSVEEQGDKFSKFLGFSMFQRHGVF